ncbi:PRC-barrel domain-containing protein [Modicisalibacter ilicicola DSM 19980]|uniref:PRC-barrel domain-containing protein n=1 Tax=Modicisalibacter ilicicola DSM 19980 TaxID=1121942 RepID=A0A1M5ABL3_9GAMM|nr:PRC-barrel domain-containing protein [Halomonas ilicicola]SHF27653.1 PRC-barrel domain-containing protein [Halomonas ilicicola DSM 19980]
MRSVNYPLAVLALALAPPAFAQDGTSPSSQASASESARLDMTTRSVEDLDYHAIYQQGGIRGRDLLGIEVFGVGDGEEIGNVRDALISGENGRIAALIAEVGGLWDLGDTHVAVPWEDVELTPEGVQVPVNEENADAYDLFEGQFPVTGQERDQAEEPGGDTSGKEPRAWKLSALINDYARLQDGSGYGYVKDVLFSESGKIQAVVVSAGGEAPARGPFAYPFYGYEQGWSPDASSYEVPHLLEDVKKVPQFKYEDYPGLWDE